MAYEPELNAKGQRLIWLDRAVVDRLRLLRGPGESFSDVILRIASVGRAFVLKPPTPRPRPGRDELANDLLRELDGRPQETRTNLSR